MKPLDYGRLYEIEGIVKINGVSQFIYPVNVGMNDFHTVNVTGSRLIVC